MMMVKCLDLIPASNWDDLAVNCLALCFDMYIESHLGLMLEQTWAPEMDPLIFLMMARLRTYWLETH